MHKLTRGALALATTSAAIAFAAPHASAAMTPDSGGVCNAGCSAYATFQSYGEIFTVHDYKKDGYGTIGWLWTWNGKKWKLHGTVVNKKGFDGPPVRRNYSIREGTPVAYAVCLRDRHGKLYNCSKVRYDHA